MIAEPITQNTYQAAFEAHRQYFQSSVRNTTARERVKKLKSLKAWVMANQARIQQACYADFRKSATETDISEVLPVTTEIKDAIAHLSTWMRPSRVGTPLPFFGTSSKIQYVPKGVVLIISPWNFPFMLAVGPLVSAIAAGCTVMIKPSEMTPATSELLVQMVKELFDPKEVSVHTGDYHVSGELLKLPFNHIFFTGSPQVGKIVMRAAAETLASVTLELGGVNPTIVDETAALKQAARRIVWAKMFNTGQVCVSPNNIYVHQSVANAFVGHAKAAIEEIFGQYPNLQSNPDFARIVNDRHYHRVKGLLDDAVSKGAKLEFGGKTDEATQYIEPAILTQVPKDAQAWNDEIFAPLIAITSYQKLEEVVADINSRPDALALYVFSKKEKHIRYILDHTQSGTVGVNEVVAQFLHPYLPFGGHNNSGIGKAHGYHGFLAFSAERAVLRKSFPISSPPFLFPPYNGFRKWLVKFLIKYL